MATSTDQDSSTSTSVLVTALGGPSSRNDPSLPNIELSIVFTITQRFQSSSNSRITTTFHNTTHSSQFPANSVMVMDSPPSSPLCAFIFREISETNIPFPLEKIHWKERDTRTHINLDKDRDQLIKLILNKARGTVDKYANSGRKLLTLGVNIERIVTLPDDEYRAMDTDKKEETRRRELSQLVDDLIRNGQQHNTPWYSILEMIRQCVSYKAPNISCLDHNYEENLLRTLYNKALRGLMHREGEQQPSKEDCSICWDEMLIIKYQEKITCLPCCHQFHRHCIVPWLKKNYSCPLCRFQLQTSQVSFFC